MNQKMPKILIFLTILSAPLYLLKFSVFGVPTNVLEVMILLSFIASISNINFFHILIYGRKKITVYIFGIGLILLGLTISTLVNKNYSVGFGIIKSWFVLPIIFGFAVYNFVRTKKDLEKILSFVYLSAFLVSLISLAYLFLGNLTYDGRLKAFYLSPNYLAMYLIPAVFIGLYFFQNSIRQPADKSKKRFYFFSLAAISASIYFTFSYGAWIAIVSGLLAYIFLKTGLAKPKFKFWLVSATVLFLIFGFFSSRQKFTDFAKNTPRSSTASRIMIYQSGWKILKDNPLWGIGPGNFQNKYLEYQKFFPPYLEWAVPEPHNLYLAFWLQGGILGLIGFLIIIIFWLKNTFQNIRQKNSTSELAVLLFVIMFSILVYGIYDTPIWKNDLSFVFWIILTLGIF
jgi:putative inorganic carbon (hco3(-)) transporter